MSLHARTWLLPAVVFVIVAGMQLALVSAAGTDIPFQDQWNVEAPLYAHWQDGSFAWCELFQPLNEHRIFWTHSLNLGLFVVNGQWDPLLQLLSSVVLRSACAAGLAWAVGRHLGAREKLVLGAVLTVAYVPLLAWHGVLWGIESQLYFALGFSLLAFVILAASELTWTRALLGGFVALAGFLAMAPAVLVPVALLGLALLKTWETRRWDVKRLCVSAALIGVAWSLRVEVAEHDALKPATVAEFVAAVLRVLAWPHANQAGAALGLNLPLLWVVVRRLLRKRSAVPGEDFVLLVAGWTFGIAVATAWARGGSLELQAGVPSRYVDFVMLLPLANLWAAGVIVRELAPRWKLEVWLVAAAWGAFLFIGWLAGSLQMWRGIVLPRSRDREAPIRLIQAFQRTNDEAVFAGQPRLLVPHPDAESVRRVLHDQRLRGKLPPSLQPAESIGPLSAGAKTILRH